MKYLSLGYGNEKGWNASSESEQDAILTFEDEGGKTKYTSRILHWTNVEGIKVLLSQLRRQAKNDTG